MFRLLIVDDEYNIVNWLYEMFKQQSHMNLDIYRAYSGNEALQWLNKTKMDIVISDICMPGINGLQLLEQIHRSWPNCKVIFLTGHDEFDYIYTASKYKGVQYLLKSEGDEEVIELVQRTICEIEENYRNYDLISKAKQQINQFIPSLQKDFFRSMMIDGNSKINVTQNILDDLEIKLNVKEPMVTIVGSLDESFPHMSAQYSQPEIVFALREAFEEYFFDLPMRVFVEYELSYFIVLIQSIEQEVNECENNDGSIEKFLVLIKGRLEDIQAVIRESFAYTVSFAIGSATVSWNVLAEKIQGLKQLVGFYSSLGNELLLSEHQVPNDLKDKIHSVDRELKNILVKVKNMEELMVHLERGRKKEFIEQLHEITDCLRTLKSKNNILALELYFSIATSFLSYINRWNLMDKVAFHIGLNKLVRIDEHGSFNDAVEYLFHLTDIILILQKNEHEKLETESQNKILTYINEHLHEDLSLTKLAEMIYFNPSYFSRLFKKQTGKNLTEYIQEARVEKAKDLLKNSNMKIHEIAALVGAESPTYFGYFFKKATNMTPIQYRDNYTKGKLIL